MKKFGFAKIFLFCLVHCSVFSQNDSINTILEDSLKQVIILSAYSSENRNKPINKIELEKENILAENIEEALQNKTPIFFKNYGAGQLTTISYRGLNAAQINVEWNGLRLNSPMLGQIDFSIIPSLNSNSIELGDAADNIGGTIKIDNKTNFKEEENLAILSEVGSFGTYTNAISYKKNTTTFSSETAFQYRRSKNNFRYQNFGLPNNPEIELENSEIQQYGIAQNFGFRFKKSILKIDYLGSINNRNLPPTKFETFSSESQNDKIQAVGSSVKINAKKNWNVRLKSGFIFNRIDFQLSENSLPEISKTGTFQQEFSASKRFDKPALFWQNELEYRYEYGIINAYENTQNRQFFIYKTSLDYSTKNHFLKAGLDNYLVSNTDIAILPSVEYQFIKNNLPAFVNFKMSYAQRVRFPTLNDLYWQPGGNEDLEPENAHNIVASVQFSNSKKQTINYSLSVEWFTILAENYIQWQPTNFGFWSPLNIQNVYSRGFESQFLLSKKVNKTFISSQFKYGYTRTTNRGGNTQLDYVPLHNMNWENSIRWKTAQLSILQEFTGGVSASETTSLGSFYLLDVALSNNFSLKNKHNLQLKFSVENILDKDFETVLNRPMPGRYFEGSIFLNFNFK